MATVQLLIDRVSYFTGLDPTNDTQDNTVILSALNQVYQDACARSGCTRTSSAGANLTSGTYAYTLASAPFSLSNVDRIIDVYITDSSFTQLLLEPLSADQLRQERSGVTQVTSTPRFYSCPDPSTIWFHPVPSTGTTAYIDYEKTPPTLVATAPAAGEESTPSSFPARFHYPCIADGAIALCLEYDKQMDEAGYYWNKWGLAVDQLAGWVNEFPGPRGNRLDGFYDTSRTRGTDQSIDLG